jgi:hypothetical protein
MAEQDRAKREQVSDMKPHLPAETIPAVPVPTSGAILDADLQAYIGRHLRAVYDEVVGEPVPDRFVRLLEELERGREGDP